MSDNPYRRIPSVSEILAIPTLGDCRTRFAHELIVAAVREEIATLRSRVSAGEPVNGDALPEQIAIRAVLRLEQQLRPKLLSVINATGIVLHTNLGRAPVSTEAAEAAKQAAGGYLNLELDLETGKRSSRQIAISEWLCRLTGAEAATAVNNNAAATVIVLRAIAQGKEVILSRGQLIEIGGSFRIPEIMAVSGAILREVGTTNITRLSDYERAIGPNTGALLQIHTSNYRVSGFTRTVSISELVSLGQRYGLPVIDDIGSGALIDFRRFGFVGEPVAKDSIAAGADLVLFSGDKLLGGPQAGIIVGKKHWIQRIEKDPMMRAFRLDKMTLAALESTLRCYLDESRALQTIPVLRLLGTPMEELRARAVRLADQIAKIPGIEDVVVREEDAFVGGGSLPDQSMKSWIVSFQPVGQSEEQLAYRLRTGRHAVMSRVQDGRLLLDLRTIFPAQMELLVQMLGEASSS